MRVHVAQTSVSGVPPSLRRRESYGFRGRTEHSDRNPQNEVCATKIRSNRRTLPGNELTRAVHLTTSELSCVGALPVDLGVLRWYQKQAGLVGFFLILGAGCTFALSESPPQR